MFNPHTKFEVSTVPSTKIMPNVKILVLSHPLGDLGVTPRVHLWLDGKHIVDFLLVIELFLLTLTAEVLLSEICRNWRYLEEWVTLSANFS